MGVAVVRHSTQHGLPGSAAAAIPITLCSAESIISELRSWIDDPAETALLCFLEST
jgi:hypothetical protein